MSIRLGVIIQRARSTYLAPVVGLDAGGASFMGASAELPEIDCRLDLSLFKTRLALLMNLFNPLGLSSEPPAPPCPEELMVQYSRVLPESNVCIKFATIDSRFRR